MQLSYVLPFFNNRPSVISHIRNWTEILSLDLVDCEMILVDDCSNEDHQVPRMERLAYYRIQSPIEWNQSGARNVGAYHSTAEWLLLSDIDYVVSATDFKVLYSHLNSLNPESIYFFSAKSHDGKDIAPHPNSFLVNRVNFLRIGGVDEDFSGNYGFEDIYFVKLWEHHFGPSILLTDIKLVHTGIHTNLVRDTKRNKEILVSKLGTLNSSTRRLRFEYTKIF